jgi:phosphatidylserine decarboxylase
MALSASRVAAGSLRVLPRTRLSRLIGRAARSVPPAPVLRAAVRAYCSAYRVDLADFEVPEGGFATFDEFFTRRLRPGSRTVDADPTTLVSPADGRLEACGRIESGHELVVKGQRCSLAELVGDPLAAASFAGGYFALVYLSPRDYHRVHAPVSGPVVTTRHIAGTLFPVNDIGFAHVPGLLVRNERVVVEQRAERHGRVITAMVGALGVGRITIGFDASVVSNDGRDAGVRRYDQRAPRLERGQELGVFHLGSTVVVLAEPGSGIESVRSAPCPVRMGDAIGRASPA